MKRMLIPCLLAVTFAACVTETGNEDVVLPGTQPDYVTTTSAIRGGTVANESTSTVGLFNTRGGICSGTLIAPNLVLTAQHCIASTPNDYVICGQSQFGRQHAANSIFVTTRTQLTNNAANYHPVREVLTPPGGDDMCGFDIALLVLANNIPQNEATPVRPRIDIEPATGDRYDAIGYGHVGDNTGAGVRRILGNRVVQCSGNQCPRHVQVTSTEFLGTSGTCQGDSGGSAIDEKGRVLGALSRGPSGCGDATYSAVWGWSDWIRETGTNAAELGGYDPDIWVTHGVSEIPEDDLDLDGILENLDNCPDVANTDQEDIDEDGLGDACDANSDDDDIDDENDNCPMFGNPDQLDFDADGFGDACDNDDDEDGVFDEDDFCPNDSNYFEVNSPCGAVAGNNDIIVLVNDDNGGGCASTSGSATPALLLLIGFFFVRRRRD